VRVVELALKASGVGAAAMAKIELHGTGTALGDPIEVSALRDALLPDRHVAPHVLKLSAAKSVTGHAETAAGVLGLWSVLEQGSARVSTAVLHLRQLNPHIQKAIDAALVDHELVKVKLNPEATEDRHEAAAALALALKADLAQVLGRTFLLYRRHPSEPKIKLP
jgi:acyl transferase domain-containing protein